MLSHNNENEDPIILITDPRVLAIPIEENHDPVIDILYQKNLAFGPPVLFTDNQDYTKMRQTLYDKLLQAQDLLPDGLRFCLYEGFRSQALQKQIFEDRYHALLKQHPQMNHEALFIETTKFASPLINLDGSINVPPHSTGGAVDVYLINQQGQVVDMGIHLDDTYEDIEGVYCKTESSLISNEAKAYRQIMSDVLTQVGMVNYPTEYWHWSYGDRYWAYMTQRPYALYGSLPI